MKLDSQQRLQFERDGYLFFPALFTAAEIRVLTDVHFEPFAPESRGGLPVPVPC